MLNKQDLLPTFTALLSSSCCVIQLLLNAFSVSCAGFSVLTPYRYLLTTLTIILLSYQLYKNRLSRIVLLVSIGLMASSDVVAWFNRSSVQMAAVAHINYRISLDGLGCEACASRIKNTLNSIEWIENTFVFFNNQTAIVLVPQDKDGKDIPNSIISTIKAIDNKYSAELIDAWAS
ncbi:hypothetical protein EDC96DRAFT_524805 [Choanephora cucurbitarum]|nr:hypothetical protein EDC96DRAFT_524805 [Choanephora cucurbitarum]